MNNNVAKWIDQHHTEILQSLAKSITVNGKERSYGLNSYFLMDSLFDKVSYSCQLNKEIMFNCFENAVYNFLDGKKSNSKLNANDLLRKYEYFCNKKIGESLGNKLLIVTSIGIKDKLKPKTINTCNIRFYDNLPNKLLKHRNKILSSVNEVGDYLWVVITVVDMELETAFEKAMESLDIYRSLIQLSTVRSVNWMFGPVKNERDMFDSKSTICLGKYHTIHNEDGTLAANKYWYEQNSNRHEPTKFQDIDSLHRHIDNASRKLNHHKFKNNMEQILVSLVKSTDIYDMELRFLKILVTLEITCDTDKSEILMKRASFIFDNDFPRKNVLNSIKESRNRLIHTGKYPNNLERKCYFLIDTIHSIVIFYLSNPFKFSSFNQMIDFMSSPEELSIIEQRQEKIKYDNYILEKAKEFLLNSQ